MARIVDLKQGKIVKCDHCNKLVEYDNEDIKSDYEFTPLFGTTHWQYVECPNCGEQIQF